MTIAITVVDDSVDEANETVVVPLSGPTVALLGATTVHTYTILDNDAPPTATRDLDRDDDDGGSGVGGGQPAAPPGPSSSP